MNLKLFSTLHDDKRTGVNICALSDQSVRNDASCIQAAINRLQNNAYLANKSRCYF